MEDTTSRAAVISPRTSFGTRSASSDERVGTRSASIDERAGTSDELVDDNEVTPSAPSRRRKSADSSTANQFSGSMIPTQFKLPADLVQSLKLHSINANETMSEIVLRCLTTADLIEKAWISTRKAG